MAESQTGMPPTEGWRRPDSLELSRRASDTNQFSGGRSRQWMAAFLTRRASDTDQALAVVNL